MAKIHLQCVAKMPHRQETPMLKQWTQDVESQDAEQFFTQFPGLFEALPGRKIQSTVDCIID